jgi:hypothetical protein
MEWMEGVSDMSVSTSLPPHFSLTPYCHTIGHTSIWYMTSSS